MLLSHASKELRRTHIRLIGAERDSQDLPSQHADELTLWTKGLDTVLLVIPS